MFPYILPKSSPTPRGADCDDFSGVFFFQALDVDHILGQLLEVGVGYIVISGNPSYRNPYGFVCINNN